MAILQAVAINGLSDASGNFGVTMGSMSANTEVVVFVQCAKNALFTLSATDTKSNTYTSQLATDDGSNTMCALLTAPNANSGANTVTISIGFAIQRFISGFIFEVSGLAASPIDAKPAIATGTGTTATATSTGTLAQASETALVCTFGDGSNTISDPSGGPSWTDSGNGTLNDTDGRRCRAATATTSATTALAPATTLGGSEPWLISIITLKNAATVKPVPVQLFQSRVL